MKENCPLCGSVQTGLLMKGAFPQKKIGFSITRPTYGPQESLYRCPGCGVVFANPLPTEEKLLKTYAQMQDPDYMEEKGAARTNEKILFLLEELSGGKGRLLDVGCFCGLLLSDARHRGWAVEGLEPSRWARQKAGEQFGLEIKYASLKEAAFPEGSFDAVMAVDVLEHFLHPREELGEMNRILKKGGLLYLSTPDVDSLAARLFRRRWWGYRPEHLFYFSLRSLRSLLASFGFEPVWEGFYSRSFTLPELLRRLKGISPGLAGFLAPLGKPLFLQKAALPLNLFDRIALIARKGR